MIAPYTLALHGVMAILSLISLVHLFYKKFDTNSKTFDAYVNWFLFFFLYNLFLVFPLIFFRELDFSASLIYVLALICLAIAAWNAFKVSLNIFGLNENSKKVVLFLYIFGAMLSAVAHLYASKVPELSPDGKWVFWYDSNLVSSAYVFIMFVAGFAFAASMIHGFLTIRSNLLKTKSILIFLGSFSLPFAVFYYFMATEIAHIYMAFLFSPIPCGLPQGYLSSPC
ncbi:MAG: hypothetical protein UX81_C0024G0001 [Parcubacteria group bacterium GW2011_GWA2_47_12]|nr:MAG: hypothetical protein UX81_C0024G0001 [Parcubacteria group bacterium GW2011_GWA2_47_12]